MGPADGHWTANGPNFITILDLNDTVLVTTGVGVVEGNGTFTGPGVTGGEIAFAAAGIDSVGVIRLSLTAPGFATVSFTGEMAADTGLNGILDGSGFNGVALAFRRYPTVDSVAVTPRSDSTLPGRARQFTAAAFDLLGRPLPPQPVTWSTSDPTRAAISASGLLTAIAPGIVAVTAQSRGIVGTAQVNVLRPVASVDVAPSALAFVVPATVPLSVTLRDATGAVVTGRAIAWSSFFAAIAQVSAAGAVTARAAGSTAVRATVILDGGSGLANVTVRTVQPTAITAGATHTCAIDADSLAACWGNPAAVGAGVTGPATIAAPVFVHGALRFRVLGGGFAHTCGLASDGSVYCWGHGGAGELGDGDTTSDSIPVGIAGPTGFIALAVGYSHTCGLVAGGAAYCWGTNLAGELGIGSTSEAPNPSPLPVSGGLSFTSLASGNGHTCGLRSDSTAYCWGGNDFGALGDSTVTGRVVPTAVAGGVRFATISAGALHTCALTGSGDAYCWGNNASGQLGDSASAIYQIAPVAVRSGGVRFTSIEGGDNHTCARATSGEIYCWGGNENGQVGPNAGTAAYLPVPVGLTGTAVAAGGHHSCALTPSGAYCWGYNQLGQLGGGSAFQQSAAPLRVSGQP